MHELDACIGGFILSLILRERERERERERMENVATNSVSIDPAPQKGPKGFLCRTSYHSPSRIEFSLGSLKSKLSCKECIEKVEERIRREIRGREKERQRTAGLVRK